MIRFKWIMIIRRWEGINQCIIMMHKMVNIIKRGKDGILSKFLSRNLKTSLDLATNKQTSNSRVLVLNIVKNNLVKWTSKLSLNLMRILIHG